MPEKSRTRALSANRQRQQIKRRSSLNNNSRTIIPHSTIAGSSIILSGIDLRTIPQKIEDLKKEILETDSKENLNNLVLMQVYISLEYGDISIENARAYLNLSKFYLHEKKYFLSQAKFHALNAREILECLNIKPNDKNFQENILAYEIYLILIQCSFNAKQREIKTKNKFILLIDKTHIDHDIKLLKKYLEKLKNFMKSNEYEKIYNQYLYIYFDIILMNIKEFNNTIYDIINQIEKTYLNNQIKKKFIYIYVQDYI